MVAASTLVGLAIAPRWGNSAVDLLYLPAVLGAAVLAGLGPALFAALASALAYNFFFTAPHLTFRIENPNDVVTVVVLFAVAVVTSQLAASVRRQARIAEAHAARNATIAGLARRLLTCTTEREIADVSTRELGEVFECNAVLVGGMPEPRLLSSAPAPIQLTPGDISVAALVLDSGERAGRGVDRAVPTEWQFHPVRSGNAVIAAVGLARDDGARPFDRTSCRCSTICSTRWRSPWSAAGWRARRASSPASGNAIRCVRSCSRRSGRTRAAAEGNHRCRRRVEAQRIGRQGARLARRLRSQQGRAIPRQPAGAGARVRRGAALRLRAAARGVLAGAAHDVVVIAEGDQKIAVGDAAVQLGEARRASERARPGKRL